MKCPKCGNSLHEKDALWVCEGCGARFCKKTPAAPAAPIEPQATAPAEQSAAPVEQSAAPVEQAAVPVTPEQPSEQQGTQMSADQQRIMELEKRLAQMEEEKKEKKPASSVGNKVAAFFAAIPPFVKSHKKLVAFSALALLVIIAVIITCVSLCGLRGVYVNEKDPTEYYTFGVSSYTCHYSLHGEECEEEGKYSLSGNTITVTSEDEFFGTITDSVEFKKLDGYSKVMIGDDTYFRAGRSLSSKAKIVFDPNGGYGGDKIKVQIGKRIKDVPTAKNYGYMISYWESADGKRFDEDDPIWQDQTYYAKWTKCDHRTMLCTDLVCPICQQSREGVAKDLLHHANVDEHCICAECGAIAHSYNNNGVCTRCGATQVKMSDTVVVGLESYAGKDLIIPNFATSIGEKAFYDNKKITSVTIPSSVTSIGMDAFAGCTGLTSVTIGSGVTSIGESAFYNCRGLTSVTIGSGVTSIGQSAFSGCSGLTSVTIPDSVTSVGYNAFYGCSGLTTITVAEGNSVYHSSGNCVIETDSKTLIVGCKSSIIPSDGSVTSIGERAFYYCTGLTSVTIPDSVTSIGAWAFSDTGLTSVTIPDSVTSIGKRAFFYCTGLTSVTIPGSVTSIGEYAFYICRGLTSINYQGTKAQWNAIEKGSGWNHDTGNYTIHCTDGDIAK